MAKQAKSVKTPKVRSMAGLKRGRPKKNPEIPANPPIVVDGDFPLHKALQTISAMENPSSEILLPSPEDSVKVLAELASLNDKALAAQKRYLELKEQTKDAKDKYDSLAEMVLTRLRVTTHRSDLPLFSEQQEQDLTRMVQAGSKDSPQDVTSAPVGDDPEAGDHLPPAVLEVPTEGGLDDSGVF